MSAGLMAAICKKYLFQVWFFTCEFVDAVELLQLTFRDHLVVYSIVQTLQL